MAIFPSRHIFCPITYDSMKIANIIEENNQILCKVSALMLLDNEIAFYFCLLCLSLLSEIVSNCLPSQIEANKA